MCFCCEPQPPAVPFDADDEDLNACFDGTPYKAEDA